jgi:hypothetical protein
LHETCMASTSLHGLAYVSPFPVSAWGWNQSRGLARLGEFLLHGGAASSKMNGCPLAVSCAVVRWCLAGSLDVHGFCMVSRPCIDEPLRLGYLSRLGCHLVECYWLLSFSSLHGMAGCRLPYGWAWDSELMGCFCLLLCNYYSAWMLCWLCSWLQMLGFSLADLQWGVLHGFAEVVWSPAPVWLWGWSCSVAWGMLASVIHG